PTMFYRMVPLAVVALALFLIFQLGVPIQAGDKAGTHEGLVVKAGNGKLTMTDKAGKNEHTHMVAKNAKITCDSKECKLEDLKAGFAVTVTVEKRDNKNVATKIEAKKK